jgi:integrase
MRLTAKAVAALTLDADENDKIWFDDDLSRFGYRLRRGAGGKTLKSWIVQYRRAVGHRRVLLGSAEVLGVEAARQAARKVLGAVALGQDPQAERRERRDADKLTMRRVIAEYLDAKAGKVKAKTMHGARRYLLAERQEEEKTEGAYFRPLHGLAIDKVSRRDIALRLNVIEREHGEIVASSARIALSAFFVWAMQEGYVEHNAVIGTKRPSRGRPRERVLTDDELVRVWNACDDLGEYGKVVRLCLLLGCRRAEIGGMTWSEFSDLDGPQPTWCLPPERSKTKRPRLLPLLPMAASIIRSVPQVVGKDTLFGVRSGAGFTKWDRHKAQLDAHSGVSAFVLHDLRRTFSTKLHDDPLAIDPHIVSALLAITGPMFPPFTTKRAIRSGCAARWRLGRTTCACWSRAASAGFCRCGCRDGQEETASLERRARQADPCWQHSIRGNKRPRSEHMAQTGHRARIHGEAAALAEALRHLR